MSIFQVLALIKTGIGYHVMRHLKTIDIFDRGWNVTLRHATGIHGQYFIFDGRYIFCFVAWAIIWSKAPRRPLCSKNGQVKVKESMTMVHKAPNHHICLPSISICQFDQDKPKGLRIVSQGNPNSTVHWLCLAHEATSTYDQIQSR